MSRIFVTGASGHIGRFLVPRLCQAGHKVYCLLRRSDPDLWRKFTSFGATVVLADLEEIDLYRDYLADAVVIHLAAQVQVGNLTRDEKLEMTRVNVEASKNLLSEFIAQGGKHFIHISSRQIIGNTNDWITEEEGERMVHSGESFVTHYAQTKAEFYLHLKQSSAPFTIITPGMIYSTMMGGTGVPHIFTLFTRGLRFTSKDTKIVYTYVEDFIHAIIRVIDRPDVTIGKEFYVNNGSLRRSELFSIFQRVLDTNRRIFKLPIGVLRGIVKVQGTFGIKSWLLNTELLNLSEMNSLLDPSRSVYILGLHYHDLEDSLLQCLETIKSLNFQRPRPIRTISH